MPSAFACQISSTAFGTGLPSRESTLPETYTSSPLIDTPSRRSAPYSYSLAPCAKNGPSTVASVVPGTVLWLSATIIIDRPRMSESRMNSWRLSSHFCPTAVRNLMPSNHSSSLSCTSRANACRCFTAAVMISRKRGFFAPRWKRSTTAAVSVSSLNWRMDSSFGCKKRSVLSNAGHATRHVQVGKLPAAHRRTDRGRSPAARTAGCFRPRLSRRLAAPRDDAPHHRGGRGGARYHRPTPQGARGLRHVRPRGGAAPRARAGAAADARLPLFRAAPAPGVRGGGEAARHARAHPPGLVRAADLLPPQPLLGLRHRYRCALARLHRAPRLRARVRLLYSEARQGHSARACARIHLRLHHLQRLLGARRADQGNGRAAGTRQGQRLRQRERDGPLPCHGGRARRPVPARDDCARERRGMGARQFARHALEVRGLHRPRVAVGNAAPGRILRLGHGGQRLRPRATALP